MAGVCQAGCSVGRKRGVAARGTAQPRWTLATPHVRRIAALAASLLVSGALTLAQTSPAAAAEAGVNLREPNVTQISDVKELGTHWVRIFVNWPDFEPARGVFAPAQLSYYEGIFASLSAGSKVIIDAVNT